MNPQHMKWAVKKLREYAESDPAIEGERLGKLLQHYAKGEMPQFLDEVRKCGDSYRVCDIFIDELCDYANKQQ